jgi:Tannase and feruloyl esterase
MNIRRIVLATIFSCGLAAAASCDSLSALKLPSTTVTAAHAIDAGAFAPPAGAQGAGLFKKLPAFCRVEGVIAPSEDSHIEFEVWMPLESAWNGKLVGVGNGGFAGSIAYPQLAQALAAGYAASSTDTGHKAGMTDGQWALGHFEKIVDYGYRAVHETAVQSKSVVKAFYGGDAKHSYFNGCSNGGRQALIEAQRFPADYDGIIAGAPANYFTHIGATFVWNNQALDEDPSTFIPAKKFAAIEAAAVDQCDAADGVKDGVINDPTRCHFNPDVLACKGAEDDKCLTGPQLAALKKVYQGSHNSKGEEIYPGFEPGGESGVGGWGLWITGFQQGKSLEHAFAFGFFADMAFQNANWDYKAFNFDHDLKLADDKTASVLNGTNADLKAFEKRGGKLIIYHGWSDAALPPTNTIHYYSTVASKMGKQTGDFVQLYMVPGMQHCGGGPGPTEFGAYAPGAAEGMSTALEQWVEHGTAPEKIIASKYKSDGNAASGVVRTRPLCPYPQQAQYKGSGSTDDAANFTCAVVK